MFFHDCAWTGQTLHPHLYKEGMEKDPKELFLVEMSFGLLSFCLVVVLQLNIRHWELCLQNKQTFRRKEQKKSLLFSKINAAWSPACKNSIVLRWLKSEDGDSPCSCPPRFGTTSARKSTTTDIVSVHWRIHSTKCTGWYSCYWSASGHSSGCYSRPLLNGNVSIVTRIGLCVVVYPRTPWKQRWRM